MDQDTKPLEGGDTQPAQGEHQAPADLSALVKEARGLDGQPAAQAAAKDGAVALTLASQNRGELHAILRMARDALLPLIAFRSERKAVMLSAIWSDDAVASIADSGAQVLALHGIVMSRAAAGLGPYLGLALSLGPVAIGTVAVLKAPDPEPADVVEGGGGQQQ